PEFSAQLHQLLMGRNGSAAERLQFSSTPVISAEKKLPLDQHLKLTALPALRSWPRERDGYLSLAMTISEHPVTGDRNLGLYRAQIVDDQRLALNFSPNSGVAAHLKIAAEMNQSLPVSLVLGSDPALLWLAAAPLPAGCDEFAFYQELFAEELVFTPGISNRMTVPANAELVIEGTISPAETIAEGPFGNHTGQYVSRADCPVMQVTAIRKMVNPIIPATVVGPPPSENIFLARANEILLREMIMIDFPQLSDLHLPLETVFHGVTMLAVKPQSIIANRRLIENLWHTSPLSRAKLLVLFDEDLDIRSLSKCWWRMINRLDFKRIYQDGGRTAFDATGIDPASIVVERGE
ncbi:MAG: UbiD family decarboxylase, partial [Desulfuromonadales bacterium]|nr:UbiD family decarboxylase [Desulfuromonadales bacterium]